MTVLFVSGFLTRFQFCSRKKIEFEIFRNYFFFSSDLIWMGKLVKSMSKNIGQLIIVSKDSQFLNTN